MEVYDPSANKYTGITPSLAPVYDNNMAEFGPQFLTNGERCSVRCGSVWCLPHTTDTMNSYMTLDLGSPKPISTVKIYNRLDCCGERLFGTTLTVGNGTTALLTVPIEVYLVQYTINVVTGGISEQKVC